MQTKKIITIVILFCIGPFFAMGAGMPEEREPIAGPTEKAQNLLAKEPLLVPAVDLSDYTLNNWEGTRLGTVEEALVDVRTGYLNYAIFDISDEVVSGGKLVPIPIRFLILDQSERSYYIDIESDEMEVLTNAPAYQKSGVVPSDKELYEISLSLNTYWQNASINPPIVLADKREEMRLMAGYGYGPGMQIFPGTIITVKRIKNAYITSSDNMVEGSIDTLIVNPKSGRIKATIFSYAGMGEKDPVVVPFSALSIEAIEKDITIDATADTIKAAPRISPDNILQAANQNTFEQQMRNYWVQRNPAFGFRSGARVLPPRQIQATELFRFDLMNWSGNSLGTVDDYLMTREGKLLYALVRPDELFGTDDNLYPVPIQALSVDRVLQQVLIGLTEKDFEQLPFIENKGALNTNIKDWDKWITDYWTSRLLSSEGTPFLYQSPKLISSVDETTPTAVYVSEFLTARVFNTDGTYIGEIEDMVVSIEDGMSDYIILSFNRFFVDLGGKEIPIPFESVTLSDDFDRILIETERGKLRNAPTMENVDFSQLDTREWNHTVNDYWAE